MGPTGSHRILQIHPTERCNLECLHCYSNSGPNARRELDASVLSAAIEDAAALGYRVLAVSGGEPLMYSGLRALLTRARAVGMQTTLTTNGTLLNGSRLDLVTECVDLLAISVDGVPASHNLLRGSASAFERLAPSLPELKHRGIRFGFIFTLTQHNVHELDWVAQYAIEQGAVLLQIHPLEEIGRAAQTLRGSAPDDLEATYALYEALRVQAYAGKRLHVQLDLTTPEAMIAAPARVYADWLPDASDCAAVVSPLVIEVDGTVVPLTYGFDRALSWGNISDHPLRFLEEHWRRDKAERFYDWCRGVYDRVTRSEDRTFLNWYDAVARGTVCAHSNAPFEEA